MLRFPIDLSKIHQNNLAKRGRISTPWGASFASEPPAHLYGVVQSWRLARPWLGASGIFNDRGSKTIFFLDLTFICKCPLPLPHLPQLL